MTNFLPVAIGGDIGSYALLRNFHEEFGIDSIALTAVATRAMANSSFVTNLVVPEINNADILIKKLVEVAQQHPDRRKILLTNADWFVELIITHSHLLQEHYDLSFCTPEAFALSGSKEQFAQVCKELNIPTPRSHAVNIPSLSSDQVVAKVAELMADLTLPLIAKPSSSAEYFYTDFPGKKKIHHIDSEPELVELLSALVTAQYPGLFLVQDFVTGDETQMRSLTAYRDHQGRVTLLATGRVLLEEHTPGTLGIPAAILVEKYDDAMTAATNFLNTIDYHGFANFDFKWDTTNLKHVFFEMNPRIGRNNYYVSAAGVSPARALINDITGGQDPEVQVTERSVLYTVVPVRLLRRYILDTALLARVDALIKAKKVANPLKYNKDASLKRIVSTRLVTLNYWRKYREHYPKPTASGY